MHDMRSAANTPFQPDVFPNRAQLEAAINRFDPDDSKYDSPCRDGHDRQLPSRQELKLYSVKKRREGFVWSHANPFDSRCGVFSTAYQQHLEDLNIPSIKVRGGNGYHEYLLVPIRQKEAVEILIFDPTAEQFYELKKPYFLGTPQELFDLHRQKAADGHFHEPYPSLEHMGMDGIYFGDHLTVANPPHYTAVTESLLDALEAVFSRTRQGYDREGLKWQLHATPLRIQQQIEEQAKASMSPLQEFTAQKTIPHGNRSFLSRMMNRIHSPPHL